MKILVLNCGSSSLKYQLIDMENETLLAKGNFERIGEDEAFVTHKVNGEKYVIKSPVKDHEEAFKIVLKQLKDESYKVINDLSEISAVGHRIVHGGEIFDKSALVDEKVIEDIIKCAALAPLHNPPAVTGIRACQKLMPGIPMAVVFDTAFHQTMPKENYLFPVPYEYYEKYGIRRYGAHGTSHQYVSKRAAELMDKPLSSLKIITCHLGQGASICAINGGKSVDTSMGLSPLGGITMVTRSGDMDPSVVTEMMIRENLTPKKANTILNKQSGLYGLTGLDPDFRTIEEKAEEGNKDAQVAVEIFVRTIAQFVAKYIVTLNGLDALVFTGGIGENQVKIRRRVCEKLEWMGIKINAQVNNVKGKEVDVTAEDSMVKIFVIPTDEELVIARDTLKLISK